MFFKLLKIKNIIIFVIVYKITKLTKKFPLQFDQ